VKLLEVWGLRESVEGLVIHGHWREATEKSGDQSKGVLA
jgi:hypothetical protein